MTERTYDYIIVGAGSAGCVLAERLTRCGKHQVLLIEAGGSDRRFWIRMPLGYARTYADPSINWCYHTQPDPGLNSRRAFWPRGRVLGGSSSINALAYVRGLPHDFDDWEAAGAEGWGWQNVQKTFEELECLEIQRADGTQQVQGLGKVRVTIPGDRAHPFTHSFFDAAREIGWNVLDNLNEPGGEGLSLLPATLHGGRRWSCSDAFLKPALRRPNLSLKTNCEIDKVNLDGRRARGVQYLKNGEIRTAVASREVIVSAGSVNSPKILQLSGIGPPDILRTHGIKVQRPLNEVGRGLQDHLAISYKFRAKVPTLNSRLGTIYGQWLAGIEYLCTGRGPLSMPVNQCGGFARSSAELPEPDMQVYCNPAAYAIHSDAKPSIASEPGYLLSAQPCRPTSRGTINVSSSDPRQPPAIQPNSLATEEDCAAAIGASRVLQRLAQSQPLRVVTESSHDPDIGQLDDADLLTFFRAHASTVYHPTCTCRMGADPQTSVLDARLRVHGLSGLRVIDASSFPNVTSGNTNAPTIMLAARGAEMVLQDIR